MTGEELEKQVQEMTEKLRKRDESDLKKTEKEFRDAMGKDTAGHVLKAFQVMQSQVADLQAQIDATNPLAPVIRAIGEVSVKLSEIEQRVAAMEKGPSE